MAGGRKRARAPEVAEEEPEALCCPITRSLLRDPVSNSLGNTYERAALLQAWARQGDEPRDPLTNEAVPDTRLRRAKPSLAPPGALATFWGDSLRCSVCCADALAGGGVAGRAPGPRA